MGTKVLFLTLHAAREIMEGFDTIIVGAGSAGCVLANRLSADPAHRVLLIEDGGDNQHPFISMAGGFVKIMGRPQYFRAFPVAEEAGRRKEMHSYGRGLGGSSAINGTWYLRGEPEDYDGWAAQGLVGWGWDDIARCFRTIENYRAPGADPARGSEGEVQITPSTYASPIFDALVEAFAGEGMPFATDVTAPGSHVGRSQYTVSRGGQRVSAHDAFVKPIRNRKNLTIVHPAIVKRIAIRHGRAIGVVCDREGSETTFTAACEVIVAAGVYGSPALLQRSGIGDGGLLQALGIAVVRESGAVGRNLCDHHKLGVSFDLANHPGTNREFVGWRLYRNALRYFLTRSGPLARVGLPITGMIASSGQAWPDFQVAAAPFAMRTINEMAASPGSPITAKPGLTFSGYHLRPRSRGSVAITTADFRTAPRVAGQIWSDPYDRDKALELFRLFRRLAAAPSLAGYIGAERMPGADVIDDDALCEMVHKMVEYGLHGTGTCTMGVDPATSVVDARCRVHGIAALRVVDGSILPTPVSGNTNGPIMAVAQRASELILADRHR